jgi:hypothetical protein
VHLLGMVHWLGMVQLLGMVRWLGMVHWLGMVQLGMVHLPSVHGAAPRLTGRSHWFFGRPHPPVDGPNG